MSNKVIFIFKAIDKYTAVGKKIAAINARVTSTFSTMKSAIGRAGAKLTKFGQQAKKVGKSMIGVGKGLSTKVTAPLLLLGAVALKQSASMESLNVSFETLIGDADKAKKVLGELIKFTATTPFQLDPVANAGRQLLAFGVTAEELVPTLRMLGELAAGTGKPIEEFSLIFGKILAKGKVQGEELLQLAEKGISLQTILAKKFKTTPAVITEAVSKGQITFKIFNEALKEITGTGGKFNKLTEKLSGTLGGLTSTLKDSTLLAFKELGDVLVKELNLKEFIADLIVLINKLTKGIAKFAKEHPTLTKFFLIMVAIVALMGPALIIIGQLVIGFAALSIVAGFLGTTIVGLTLPILAIIGAVGLLIAAIVLLAIRWDDVMAGLKLAVSDLPDFFDFILDSVLSIFGTSLAAVRLIITEFIESTVRAFQVIVDKLAAIKDKIFGSIASIKDSITGFFDFSSDISTSASSVTDVNINLSAPQGTIQSIKSQTTGKNPGLNVGINMATSL